MSTPTPTQAVEAPADKHAAKLRKKILSLGKEVLIIRNKGFSAISVEADRAIFRGMYQTLDRTYNNFTEHFEALCDYCEEKGITPPTREDETYLSEIRNYYYEALGFYQVLLEKTAQPSFPAGGGEVTMNQSFNPAQSRHILPKIKIKPFCGELSQWPTFKEMFRSLIIDDASLSPAERFHFLTSYTEGQAYDVIKHIKVCEANFAQAWEALTEVYDNDRKLACSYLDRFLSFKSSAGKPSVESLQLFLANVSESITSLQTMGIPHFDEYLLCELALKSLDPITREAFEVSIIGTKYPRFSVLKRFVQERCGVLRLTTSDSHSKSDQSSSIPSPSNKHPKPRNPNQHTPKGSNNSHMLMTRDSKKDNGASNKSSSDSQTPFECFICKASHTIRDCERFKTSSPEQRLSLLKNWSGCHNCLHPKHCSSECTSKWSCRLCSERHHTLLHLPSASNNATAPSAPGFIGASTSHTSQGVLLGTITALLKDAQGNFHRYRGILDPGSQFSVVTSHCAKALGKSTRPYHGHISGVNNSPITNIVGKVPLTLRPTSSPIPLETDAVVVPSITSPLPQVTLQSTMWADYLTYDLSDPDFVTPGEISFLIGADLYPEIVTGTPITIHKRGPKLLGTIFGYTVMGRYLEDPLSNSKPQVPEHAHVSLLTLDNLSTVIERFWEVEEPSVTYGLTAEDQECENHFVATHRRDSTGRYVVALPFKSHSPTIIPNRNRALSRFSSLESKLAKDPQLKSEYIKFMDEYLELGHMSKATTDPSYLIPHHAVYKVDSSGKGKLRVVFDGSFRTPTGSLNDHLHAGPKLQADISDIILRFRRPAFVLTCDVVKMFRQIIVCESDRRFQQIVWRSSPTEELNLYELNTVTYGLRCSPYLSQRVLKQIVLDEGGAYPMASKAILQNTYVDDIADGCDSVEQLVELKNQLIDLLSKGGFELSKWKSNYLPLLDGLPSSPHQQVQLGKEANEKILGMQWDPVSDTLSYQIDQPTEGVTKRIVSSNIGRLFDPLGYLTPVIFLAKCIFQETWSAGIDWDEDLPLPAQALWTKFTSELSTLSNIRIPRALPKSDTTYQLLCFSDASAKGYCAAIYLRATDGDTASVTLMKAKSRLAPLKTLTIPRLELEGAVLVTRLLRSIQHTLDQIDIHDIFCFTDSMVVLAWLRTPPHALKMFVANRVQHVLEGTESSWWHHIRGTENPADVGSRGLMPSALQEHALWWTGPSWAVLPIEDWPISREVPIIEDLPELKTTKVILVGVTVTNDLMKTIDRFSSFQRLIRVFAYVRRFISNSRIPKRRRNRRRRGDITSMEFYKAKQLCIKLVQQHYYPEAFDPKNFNSLSTELRQLAVFSDHEGVLRVGGRLTKAPLTIDQRHPVLLPPRAHFTRLVVAYYHTLNHHAGPSALLATIRQQFWIPRARNLVKQHKGSCVTCVRFSKAVRIPFMGDLPASRFDSSRPFAQTGIDLAGPFLCKDSAKRKHSTSKVWLCVFVCLSTRAVHLELVTGLSVEAFLDAFDRFVSRRSLPAHIYSDCGTNFVGASGYIREVMDWFNKESTQDAILRHTCHLSVQWSFNPPAAPHFGGGWEAAVKSSKNLLYKIFGDHPYTSDELSTVFTKIEAILNSRPLVPLSDSPQDANPLTPGHFLVGQPLNALPEPDFSDVPCNRLDRWQFLRERVQHFWHRWREEYLTTLQRREKWNQRTPNLRVGDVVIVTDARPSPALWPLARITEVHPGNDGTVRVATIKTSKGIYKRPIVKLVPLPINGHCN